MRPISRATLVLATLTLTSPLFLTDLACRPKAPPTTQIIAPPVTDDQLKEIRDSYLQRDPTVVVGVVAATLPDSNLAAVTGVPVAQFMAGQLVTFIDSNQEIIAVGNVLTVTADAVHVRYRAQGPDGRAPREGDVAVKVKS